MANVTDLHGPVTAALAKTIERLPRSFALVGGARYELKWDGYRCAIVIRGGRVHLWSRQGNDLTDRFPDIRAAVTAQVPTTRSWTVNSSSGAKADSTSTPSKRG